MTDRARFERLSEKASSLRRRIADDMGKRIKAGIAALERGEMGPNSELVAASKAEVRRLQKAFAPVDDAALAAFKKAEQAMLVEGTARLDHLCAQDRQAVAAEGSVEAMYHAVREIRHAGMNLRTPNMVSPTIPDAEALDREAQQEFREHKAAKKAALLARLRIDDLGAPEDPLNPRIETATAKWFAERRQGPAAVKRHQTSVRRFTELQGNVLVRSITRQMVRDYVKAIENLPDHRRLPTEKRGGLADPDPDVPRVAAPTVERHLVSIKALLKFCVEQDWITINVATALKGPKDTRPKASRRRVFTRGEREQVLAQAIEEHGDNGDMPWLIRLGAYTGARLEELAQLARRNVRQVDGVWVIDFDDLDGRNLKNQSSVKQIPLHPAIRDQFIAWVLAGKSDRVFASFVAEHGRFANKLSGEFGRLMDRASLPDPRLVFHSLRHTLKREMSNARIDPDVRRAILGHAPRDAHDGYAGHSLEAIADEFVRLSPLF